MLLDEVLYQAVDVAATIWDATQKETYTQQARKFYKWANQPNKNISGTPDNVDPRTKKKYARQRAKWFGKTWKEHLSDVLWNLVVVVFDDVRKLHEADIKAGLVDVTYYWDDEINEIERDVPKAEKGSTEEEQAADLPATPKAAETEVSDQAGNGVDDDPLLKRCHKWLPYASAAAVLVLGFLMMNPFFSPDQALPANENNFLTEDLSFSDAAIVTTVSENVMTSKRSLKNWHGYSIAWESRSLTP